MPYRDITILSINCSDSTGQSGVQADVKTIAALGCHTISAITAITTQGQLGVKHVNDLSASAVVGQVQSLLDDGEPNAVKVGMLRDPNTIQQVSALIADHPSIVCAPGILDTQGRQLADKASVQALTQYLVPRARLLVARCASAEMMLGMPIRSDEEMLAAAERFCRLGAKWVMLRGGLQQQGRCTALLYGHGTSQFFSSYNVEVWQQHGIGGALSSAIASRLAIGDSVPAAIRNAHDYIHSQVVSAIRPDNRHLRPSDHYNKMLSLLAQHYKEAHDVAFYADQMAISTRYLSRITAQCIGKSPKQVIADYLVSQARILLETSRLSMQEVAERLGFSNQSSFSRFFRQHTGKAPSNH